jgi:hypothetical protein
MTSNLAGNTIGYMPSDQTLIKLTRLIMPTKKEKKESGRTTLSNTASMPDADGPYLPELQVAHAQSTQVL